MGFTNIEIKARCHDPEKVRQVLRSHDVEFIGTDHQVDTYFHVPAGRLKLREGIIENVLIFYRRDDHAGPKEAVGKIFPNPRGSELKSLLTEALGIKVVVDKEREIYYAGNVKIHLDLVKDLGTFLEIEAQDHDGSRSREELEKQCTQWLGLLEVRDEDLFTSSYSDMTGV